MNTHKPLKLEYRFLAAITTGFVFWLWLSLILTLSNAFFTPLILTCFGATLAFGAYFIYTKKLYKHISREFLAVTAVAIIIGAILTLITVPSIFSGRDQGSYSAAAIHLAQNHKLAFSTPAVSSFFALHGPGKALNFPGFNYTADGLLTTQFPLGYISWLASCFALFDLFGLSLANAFTVALFLIAFYFLIRLFASRFYAIWGLLIAATSLPVVWFSKSTLSENLALTLFTLLALNLIATFKEKSNIYPLLSLAIASFLVFTRIEGIAFFIIALIILSFSERIRTLWKSKPLTYIIFPFIFFTILFIRNLFVDFPFYKTIAKAGLGKWQSFFEPCLATDCITDKSLSLWSIFWPYGLVSLFIIGSIGIIILFKSRRTLTLIPVLLALPTFFYFFSPNISIDHPWMLRRFIFSLYPSLLFSAIIGIAIIQEFLTRKYAGRFFFKKHYYAVILLATILFSQLPFALQYATFSENKDLLEQTQTLAQHFSDKDLILVDRLVTGDAWSMIPEPLNFMGIKNAVYFFNPKDFATLDTKTFENVYLIVSESEAARYTQSSLKKYTPIATYNFTSERLAPSTEVMLPQKIHEITKVTVFKIE
jgi:hypothetical protein